MWTCGLCVQRVSKPAEESNPRKGHISGVKLRRAHRLEVCVPPKKIRTGNLDLD